MGTVMRLAQHRIQLAIESAAMYLQDLAIIDIIVLHKSRPDAIAPKYSRLIACNIKQPFQL